MSKAHSGRQAVPLDEVVLAQSFELAALITVLERKQVISRSEVLEEIKRLREQTPRGKWSEGPQLPAASQGNYRDPGTSPLNTPPTGSVWFPPKFPTTSSLD